MSSDRPVRITDVAAAAGVSIATVSRVLNGSSTVDPVLAERVRVAARAARYVPNSNGRALRRQRADVWAAIVSDVKNPFFTSLVTAVEHVAVRSGHSVMLCNTDEQLERERGYLDAAIAQRMSGVVVSVTSEEQSDLAPLLAAGIPTVVVDRRVHDFAGDSILLDNERVGRLAVEHLLALGHRDILCLAGPSGVSTTEDRLDGVRHALAEAGVVFEHERMVRTDLRMADAEDAVLAAVSGPKPPDAVVAMNGPLTAGAYRGIQRSGFRLPEDISLVGVDDDTWTQLVHPAVTLVAQPVDEMGTRAAERLNVRAIHDDVAPVHLLLEPELLVRGTTTQRL
ncbi:LacI family DNA-binding transcriptional regulator [Ruania alkalisoli]|uniref:LacI family DNA-binding transcriptional regulator n=1 Tax=Ruania alkalisoli TaxID=2779775 RepID=A0A7M1SNY2_9MICO|nr:LacI family DNA-binding transcriptional regulator [Ruania alkalisoli]QOR69280.1 LacI family DNA-binding transcriptional regulator [Ruania alkalisoli]